MAYLNTFADDWIGHAACDTAYGASLAVDVVKTFMGKNFTGYAIGDDDDEEPLWLRLKWGVAIASRALDVWTSCRHRNDDASVRRRSAIRVAHFSKIIVLPTSGTQLRTNCQLGASGVFRCINRPWACHQSSCSIVVSVRVWVSFSSGLGLRRVTGARRRVLSVGTDDSGTVEARCQPELCRSLMGDRVLEGNGMETLMDDTCTWSLSYFYSVDARLGLAREAEGLGGLRNVYRTKPHRQ